MTSAKIDYEGVQDKIIEWYEENKKLLTSHPQ